VRDLYSARMPDDPKDLRDNAERCRRLACVVEEERTRQMLLEIAQAFEEQAAVLEGRRDT